VGAKLPVKALDGTLRHVKVVKQTKSEHVYAVEATEDAGGDDSEVELPVVPKLSKRTLVEMQSRRLARIKAEMAVLCEAILAEPESSIKAPKPKPEGRGWQAGNEEEGGKGKGRGKGKGKGKGKDSGKRSWNEANEHTEATVNKTAPQTPVEVATTKSKLEQLHEFCTDDDLAVQRIAIISELGVFQDILPDYRIRAPTQKELMVKVKKEVKKLREFEARLLRSYQEFLKTLEGCVNLVSRDRNLVADERDISLATTAIKCLCRLLSHKSNFNFATNVMVIVVRFADHHMLALRAPCCNAIVELFRSKNASLLSSHLDVVKTISKYVSAKKFKVQEMLMESLLNLQLTIDMDSVNTEAQKAQAERRKKKKMGILKDEVSSDLKEAEAVVDSATQRQIQGKLLKEVTLIYFRFLKTSIDSPLIPIVLRGLAKWAHLINLDVVVDLVERLKGLLRSMEDSDNEIHLTTGLQCVLTGIEILQGPGRELKIDEKEFVHFLYKLLLQFGDASQAPPREEDGMMTTSQRDSTLPILLRCVWAAFIRRKEYSNQRVASFVKRLSMIALIIPQPPSVFSVLSMIEVLLNRYPKVAQLLECEQERVMSGLYLPAGQDPELSNAFSTSLWELALLRRHAEPTVANLANKLIWMADKTQRFQLPNHPVLPQTKDMKGNEALDALSSIGPTGKFKKKYVGNHLGKRERKGKRKR
jgi:hypothetical protein